MDIQDMAVSVRPRLSPCSPTLTLPRKGGGKNISAFNYFSLPPCVGGLGWGVKPHAPFEKDDAPPLLRLGLGLAVGAAAERGEVAEGGHLVAHGVAFAAQE